MKTTAFSRYSRTTVSEEEAEEGEKHCNFFEDCSLPNTVVGKPLQATPFSRQFSR
jgi:hypothetical protein